MNIAIIIAVGYVVPLLILRNITQRLANERAAYPDVAELVLNIIPVLNIVSIPIAYHELRQLQKKRTITDIFYNIPKDVTTNRGDSE